MKYRRVQALSPEAVDALVNGTQGAADGGEAAAKPAGLAK